MATYIEGGRYLRNKNTGAVFQYRAQIAGMADLVEMVGDAEGNLVKVPNRAPEETAKLNPTKTPEKAATAAKPAQAPKPAGTPAAKPTMKPVDVK